MVRRDALRVVLVFSSWTMNISTSLSIPQVVLNSLLFLVRNRPMLLKSPSTIHSFFSQEDSLLIVDGEVAVSASSPRWAHAIMWAPA